MEPSWLGRDRSRPPLLGDPTTLVPNAVLCYDFVYALFYAMLCDSVLDAAPRLVTNKGDVRPMIVHVWLVVMGVGGIQSGDLGAQWVVASQRATEYATRAAERDSTLPLTGHQSEP